MITREIIEEIKQVRLHNNPHYVGLIYKKTRLLQEIEDINSELNALEADID